MGYLNDLRKQSGSKKAVEEQQRLARIKREEFHKKAIIPALKNLYGYLNEVVEHLNYLDHEIFVNYYLGSLGRLKDLVQTDYSLYVDSRKNMTQIMLKFKCKKPTPLKFNIDGEKNVSRVHDYLNTTSLEYRQQNEYDRVHTVKNADFTIKAEVNVGFEFTADINNSCISLRVKNFEEFGMKSRRLRVEDVKHEFMEHLARYISHEVDDFFGLDMEDDLKATIQEKLKLEQQHRDQEMQDMEQLQAFEMLEKQKNKKSYSMFQLFKRSNKD